MLRYLLVGVLLIVVNNGFAQKIIEVNESDSHEHGDSLSTIRIEAALVKSCNFSMTDEPVEEFAESLSNTFDINVMIDFVALESIGVDPKATTITTEVKEISLESALSIALKPLELEFIIDNGNLLITSVEESRAMSETRVYDITDLVKTASIADQFAATKSIFVDADPIIDLIQTAIEPEMWDSVGGPGTLSVNTIGTRTLLPISQTFHVHRKIKKLLDELQEIADSEKEKTNEEVAKVEIFALDPKSDSSPDQLVEIIKTATGEKKWEEKDFFAKVIGTTIVVKHTRKMQRDIAKILYGLDALKKRTVNYPQPQNPSHSEG